MEVHKMEVYKMFYYMYICYPPSPRFGRKIYELMQQHT